MLLVITNLKILFLSNSAIFFYLDIVYSANSASIFLINILDLFIRKQIFNKTAILACYEYFLSCPLSYLIKVRKAKIAENNLAIYSIKEISARNISI